MDADEGFQESSIDGSNGGLNEGFSECLNEGQVSSWEVYRGVQRRTNLLFDNIYSFFRRIYPCLAKCTPLSSEAGVRHITSPARWSEGRAPSNKRCNRQWCRQSQSCVRILSRLLEQLPHGAACGAMACDALSPTALFAAAVRGCLKACEG